MSAADRGEPGGAQPVRAVGAGCARARAMAASHPALDRLCGASEGAGAGLSSGKRAVHLVQSREGARAIRGRASRRNADDRQGLSGVAGQIPREATEEDGPVLVGDAGQREGDIGVRGGERHPAGFREPRGIHRVAAGCGLSIVPSGTAGGGAGRVLARYGPRRLEADDGAARSPGAPGGDGAAIDRFPPARRKCRGAGSPGGG